MYNRRSLLQQSRLFSRTELKVYITSSLGPYAFTLLLRCYPIYIFWLVSDTANYRLRLPTAKINEINAILKIAALSRPVEFARPVKDIGRYKKFKCTQNRQFLLYLSIVCLKNVLHKFQYEHFFVVHWTTHLE